MTLMGWNLLAVRGPRSGLDKVEGVQAVQAKPAAHLHFRHERHAEALSYWFLYGE
jgi:hypothetical protein